MMKEGRGWRKGDQEIRVSGKRIEDRGQKTEDRHGGISNTEQGISNAEGGKRMEDGHLRVYTRSLLQRREKPKISANPEPL